MMTILTMMQSVRCVNSKRTREAMCCSICAVVQKEQDPTWDISLGFAPICLDSSDRLLKLERNSIFTSILKNELRKLQWNPPSHDSSGLDRRDGGTVLSSPRGQHRKLESCQKWTAARKLSESIRSYRRICARYSIPKLQLTWRVTRIKCCESIFLKLPEVTEMRYFLLIWKKFTSRDIRFKRKTRTTKPRQHDLCQNGKSGSSSDNMVTWDIRRRRSWLVLYDTQEQDGKLYGLFFKSYVVHRAKHGFYRCLSVQECYHRCLLFNQCIGTDLVDWEVRGGTSAKALNVVCWCTGLHIVSALVDKLHRQDRDERVQNCLGETFWMAGDHCA